MQWLGWPITMYWICVTLIFFRAIDLPHAFAALRSCVLFRDAGPEDLGVWMLWVVFALGLLHYLNFRGAFSHWWRRLPDPVFAGSYGCLAGIVLLFVPQHYRPFIYFQF